jgi:transcription termination factor Rho
MAEANDQPTLLSEELTRSRKPRRSRTGNGEEAAPRKGPAKKAAPRRQRKAEEPENVEPVEPTGTLVTKELPSPEETAPHVSPGEPEIQTTQDQSVESNGQVVPEMPPSQQRREHYRTEGAPVAEQPRPEPVYGEGLIEVSGKGFGFLRDPKRNYVQSPQDIFVTPEVVRRHALRDGFWIKGEIRRGSRGQQLFRLTEINGENPDKYRELPVFEELTSINPTQRVRLETVPDRYTTRVMDLMTPIGKGQRGLIVAPPRTGKTTLLQHIADAVVRNHPEMQLIILLVDERPEEVTEIRRTVPKADIMASSNDSDLKSHTRIAQLAIERAKRLVEAGKDVFVLMDSLTRIGRAFNNAISGSGRTMSGGMDSRAMEIPRKLFAAARNTEEAGSLTIMATALIETGSKMDELIFQEFKGTGNMEMVLDRQISDQRTYPAIDIFKSGTRREELLLPPNDLEKINTIRRGLAGHRPTEAIERLLSFLRKFPTNAQMLREIPG